MLFQGGKLLNQSINHPKEPDALESAASHNRGHPLHDSSEATLELVIEHAEFSAHRPYFLVPAAAVKSDGITHETLIVLGHMRPPLSTRVASVLLAVLVFGITASSAAPSYTHLPTIISLGKGRSKASNSIIRRSQWDGNSGYCGETSFIQVRPLA